VDQLATTLAAERTTPLAHRGDWLVMAAWLVWLRSRLPLPLDSPAQQQAEAEAGQLRENLLALRAAQGLAAWLADRPQLGSEVIARGAPEWVGTALAASYQVDVVGFLWASMALFDDGSRDVDTDIVYRPPWHDLLSTRDARERILALLASQPDGASLERFLPAHDADDDRRARPGLRRRSALASTLLGSLELTRQGDITLAQQEALLPIHLRRANAGAAATTGVLNSDHLVTA
jgi:segregation and condensation protein A